MTDKQAPGIADEIRKALDAATPGPWLAGNRDDGECLFDHPHGDGDCVYLKHELLNDKYYARIKRKDDARLIANAPTWLRSLLEENGKLRQERDAKLAFISKGNDENMYWLQEENIRLESELEQVKKERDEWEKGELKHYLSEKEDIIQALRSELAAKEFKLSEKEKDYSGACGGASELGAEWRKSIREVKLLRSELAAKDKELKWYADEQYGDVQFFPPIPDIPILHDCGERARSILFQYATINESKEGETDV